MRVRRHSFIVCEAMTIKMFIKMIELSVALGLKKNALNTMGVNVGQDCGTNKCARLKSLP